MLIQKGWPQMPERLEFEVFFHTEGRQLSVLPKQTAKLPEAVEKMVAETMAPYVGALHTNRAMEEIECALKALSYRLKDMGLEPVDFVQEGWVWEFPS